MYRLTPLVAIVFAGGFASAAFADHICTNSPGEVFVGYSQGGNGVAPMPICRSTGGEGQDVAQSVRVIDRWEVQEDRFGAIAISSSDGAYATSSNLPTREAAEREALAQCRARGGEACAVAGYHQNLCTTFAWGGGRYAINAAPTVESSREKSLRVCAEESGGDCEVIETFCSTPVSHWVYEKPDNWVPKQVDSD
ncbi:DUF4189 domain-containing protein [Silanimonas sp.]|uniref:DUF4189 domain-containing protein n=1 Tax=Silanimonas sp. TaxID=1929290 RepID=UPI0037C70CF5